MGGFVIVFVNVDSYSGVPSCTFESWFEWKLSDAYLEVFDDCC